jgi:hypothetical protein
VVGEEEPADLGGAAERAADVGGVREAAACLEPDHDDDLDEQRAGREHGADRLPAGPARPRRFLARADVRDDEQEHHHHSTRVDEHLSRGDELRGEQEVEDGERGEVADQRERREERVSERDDGHP